MVTNIWIVWNKVDTDEIATNATENVDKRSPQPA